MSPVNCYSLATFYSVSFRGMVPIAKMFQVFIIILKVNYIKIHIS